MVDILRAVSDDAADLHTVAAATFALACPPTTTTEAIAEFIESTLSERRMREYLADPARELFLAREGARSIGYTMLVYGEPSDPEVLAAITSRPTAELSKCYLLAGHHGGGVAASLVAASVASARARGAAAVWLGVNQANARANAFYEKCGFRRVGTKHFLVGRSLENDFVRELVL